LAAVATSFASSSASALVASSFSALSRRDAIDAVRTLRAATSITTCAAIAPTSRVDERGLILRDGVQRLRVTHDRVEGLLDLRPVQRALQRHIGPQRLFVLAREPQPHVGHEIRVDALDDADDQHADLLRPGQEQRPQRSVHGDQCVAHPGQDVHDERARIRADRLPRDG
jgi:hypothetical protein